MFAKGTSTKPLESAEVILGEGDEQAVTAKLTGPHPVEADCAPAPTVLAANRRRDPDALSKPPAHPGILVQAV